MSLRRLLTPYRLGPSASVIGGHDDTVLIPSFAMPTALALRYAATAAGRGATALLLRTPNQSMPTAAEFDRLGLPNSLLLTVSDEYAEDKLTDKEAFADLEVAINDCSQEIDLGLALEDGDGPAVSAQSSMPDLPPAERLEFLRAFYGTRNEDAP